ncbi:MAG TPA: F0F1 ATP synthase subunit epsilon [Lacipirellulaceae bacterium]|jgi:F-type H+-transporting ATPase subunit epsilon|nr:F0F1 ATP synthase subunit epsilon [Lacipirellulaceae bacterium]
MADIHATTSTTLRCIVVTPEATAVDTPCEFVAVPLADGEAGIAPGRAALIGRLGYGELRVRHGGQTSRYYVDGGFVQVADNLVSVLTNKAVEAANLNAGAAQEQLVQARSAHAAGEAEMAARDRHIAQARGQLRVAGHTGAARTGH